jgi:hypothetical protein
MKFIKDACIELIWEASSYKNYLRVTNYVRINQFYYILLLSIQGFGSIGPFRDSWSSQLVILVLFSALE